MRVNPIKPSSDHPTHPLLTRRGTAEVGRPWAARRAWLAALLLVTITSSASARPKRRDSRAAFDRGVAAYKKNNFVAASEALARSFELEADVDTLFAWAQSERKLEHCDKASELYEKLLTYNLPPENKTAVDAKLEECRQIIAAAAPPVEPAPPPVAPPPPPVAPAPPPAPAPVVRSRSWYRDPVALGLLGAGIVGVGAGGGFLLSAQSNNSSIHDAGTYDQATNFSKHAKTRGTIGLVAGSVGGALIVGGVVWIVIHRQGTEPPVTAWLAPTGGGVAFNGAF
jgi:hypothetical protein